LLEIFVDKINPLAISVDLLPLGEDLGLCGRKIAFFIVASAIVNVVIYVGLYKCR